MSQATIDKLNALTEDVAIEVSGLTKDYGKGRGIFDISFKIPKGKTFGYCGTNGAGKTTTLRHIMGFLKPDSGTVRVLGVDPWKEGDKITDDMLVYMSFEGISDNTEFYFDKKDIIDKELKTIPSSRHVSKNDFSE